MIRRKGREIALQILYLKEMNDVSLEEALKEYLEHFTRAHPMALKFAKELVSGIEKFKDKIDQVIAKYTPSWPLERLNVTDKNILRIALYEMFYRPDIPEVVSINEAVEIAKQYGSDESPGFINAVLDRIYKKEIKPLKEKEKFLEKSSENGN